MAFHCLKNASKYLLIAGCMLITSTAQAGTLTNVSVTAGDYSPGATTTYTFTYTLATDVYADEALLFVNFPPQFTVADGACDRINSFTLSPDPGGVICRASYGSGHLVAFAVNTSIQGGNDIPAGTTVSVVVGGVTNPTTPGSYVFDPNATPNFDTGIRTVSQPNDFAPTEIDVAPQQTVTIGAVSPVNGNCGTSHTQLFTSPPAGNLCAAGTASAVTTNPTNYTWSCNGTGGGTNSDCNADKGYDLIFSISPASSGSINCTNNPVIHGGSTSCTATASAGYSFSHWSGDCTGANCTLSNVTSQLNPQANFSLNTYPITTQVSPAGAGSVTCDNNPVEHSATSTCTYTANPGYTFSNWSGDCTGSSCVLPNATTAKTVTANFIPPSFNISNSVVPANAGTVTCSASSVVLGSSATCTASAGEAYTFTGWSGDCTGTETTCNLSAVAANKQVNANFARRTYTITSTASPQAAGVLNCPTSIEHGGAGSCTATANTGYTFAGWVGCSSANGTQCNLTNVTANRNISADFTIKSYQITAIVNPSNAGSVNCTSPVSHANSATCTATPSSSYRFLNWSGACTGATCTFASVTENTSVTANFELLPTYNIASQANPVEGGTISCSQNVVSGSTGNCSAQAASGYRFNNWSGDCSGTVANCSLANVTSAKSVIANFEKTNLIPVYIIRRSVKGETIQKALALESAAGSQPLFTFSADSSNFRAFQSGCEKVYGNVCVPSTIPLTGSLDIIVLLGRLAENTVIKPSGAGAVWCDDITRVPIDENGNAILDNCVIDANPGFTFTSIKQPADCRIGLEESCRTLEVNFSTQSNTPVVSCTNCNNSVTSTDTTNIAISSKTSTPDPQGNAIGSAVTTAKNTETGLVTTTARVSQLVQTNNTTETKAGGQVNTNDPNAVVLVNDNNTVSLTTNNPATGLSTSAVVSNQGNQIQTSGAELNASLSTAAGLNTSIEQSEQGTKLTITNEADGSTIGTNTIASSTFISEVTNSPTVVASTRFDVVEEITPNLSISQFRHDRELFLINLRRQHSELLEQGSRASSLSIIPPNNPPIDLELSNQLADLIIVVGTGIGDLSSQADPSGSTNEEYISLYDLIGSSTPSSSTQPNNANIQGMMATKETPKVAIDMNGSTLEKVRIFSEKSGTVDLFSTESSSNAPRLKALESTDESFNLILSYPPAK